MIFTLSSHFVWISAGEARRFWNRDQHLQQTFPIITVDKSEQKNSELKSSVKYVTSRLTAKIGQWRPIKSCHTILDWNMERANWRSESQLQQNSTTIHKDMYERRGFKNALSGIGPSGSSGRCRRADKHCRSEEGAAPEARAAPTEFYSFHGRRFPSFSACLITDKLTTLLDFYGERKSSGRSDGWASNRRRRRWWHGGPNRGPVQPI